MSGTRLTCVVFPLLLQIFTTTGTSAKSRRLFFTSVCLPARLLSKCYEQILTKLLRGMGHGTRNNRLDFGSVPDHDPRFLDPDHDLDPGIFKGFFTYHCDSYRQARTKLENP